MEEVGNKEQEFLNMRFLCGFTLAVLQKQDQITLCG